MMNEIIKERLALIQNGTIPHGYKKTRAGIMPEDWAGAVRAKDAFKNHTDKKHNGDLEILAATQENGIVPRSQIGIDIQCSEEGVNGYKKVSKGDFVISLRSFQGGIEYSEYDGIVSPAYTVLQPVREISDGYYRNYFKTNSFIQRLNGAVYGIRDGKQIGYQDFGDMYIHYPPIEEQKKIAKILAQCDRVVALKQERLDEEKRKKQGIVKSIFASNDHNEWTEEPFSSVCTFINGRAYKQEELLKSGKYPVLRVGNLFTKSEWYYSDLELTEDKYIDSGDLIYAWSASFGPQLWEGGKVIYHYHIWKVIPNEKIDKDYLYQYFMYDVELLAKEQQGGTMSHITKQTMENRICHFPSLHKQKQIAHLLSMVDQKIELLQTELNEWELKKKALMQLLLTGIVRVKP